MVEKSILVIYCCITTCPKTQQLNTQIFIITYIFRESGIHVPSYSDSLMESSQGEVAQSYLTLCDPTDCSLPGSSIHGIFQASTGVGCHCLLQRIFPTQGLNPGLPHCRQTLYCLSHQGSPLKVYRFEIENVSCSVMSDSVTPWTVARQAPLSMEFSRQEYWSG